MNKSLQSEELFSWILSKLAERKRVALITIIEKRGSAPRGVSSKMVVAEDGEYKGTIGGGELERIVINQAIDALRNGDSKLLKVNLFRSNLLSNEIETKSQICGGAVTLFIDVINPSKRAFIIGAGHVARSLTEILSMVGFKVIVIDNMPEYASKNALPNADQVIVDEDPASVINNLLFSKDDVVIITHGDADIEYKVLYAIYSKTNLPNYVGLLAGKGKLLYILRKLVENGIDKDKLSSTLYSPAGLSIGSESPEEIAISIVAEILKVFNKAEGIHESIVNELLKKL